MQQGLIWVWAESGPAAFIHSTQRHPAINPLKANTAPGVERQVFGHSLLVADVAVYITELHMCSPCVLSENGALPRCKARLRVVPQHALLMGCR